MIGFLPFALTDETVTSLRALTFVVSFTFSCEKEKIENREMKIEDTIFLFVLGTWYLVLGTFYYEFNSSERAAAKSRE